MQVKYLTEKVSGGKILRRDTYRMRQYRMRSSNVCLIGVPEEDNRGNGGKGSCE